jgi:Ser/Thr protein kinase RdoA (MazF antagonist)
MSSLPDMSGAQKQVQRLQEVWMRPMAKLKRSTKDLYTEAEAAAALGISTARLHELLDEYIFTNGNRRPEAIQFTSSDLLLLSYWSNGNKRAVTREVITMPRRG